MACQWDRRLTSRFQPKSNSFLAAAFGASRLRGFEPSLKPQSAFLGRGLTRSTWQDGIGPEKNAALGESWCWPDDIEE